MDATAPCKSFELIDGGAAGPVIVSVPHAGRHYSASLGEMLRVPPERLRALEDRYVDRIARRIGDCPCLVAGQPRVWIDLNRAETDLDPDMVIPRPAASGVIPSAKVRGGLGLVPRRLAGVGDIWRGALPAAALAERIARDHRPYHTALAALIDRSVARFGTAVLIDLHSMPPLDPKRWPATPSIVVGDRHGRSADPRFTARVIEQAAAARLKAVANDPYAGGHIVERHGRPTHGVHALQIEIDRRLYLDADGDAPAPAGVDRMRRWLAAVIDAVSDEALGGFAQAAE